MTLTSSEVTEELTPFEFAPGRKASWATLRRMLPDVETALFFGRAFKLDYKKLSKVIYTVFDGLPIVQALAAGDHSTDLQDYIVDVVPTDVIQKAGVQFTGPTPQGVLLPAMWDYIDLEVAKSLLEVANKLTGVLDALPSKYGDMAFKHMAKVNRQRPTIVGTYGARIHHPNVVNNLLILDVSGSMTEATVRAIAGDAVALGWKANATFAIVSNTCQVWEPGTYSVDDVLRAAEYGGTQYETLAPLFDQDWGTVITIADYDSSYSAKAPIASKPGRIASVIDISLVNRPTYLAECVGQLADKVEPLLIASSAHVLAS